MAVRATFKRTSGVLCYSSSSPFSDGFRCWDEGSTMLAATLTKASSVLAAERWECDDRWLWNEHDENRYRPVRGTNIFIVSKGVSVSEKGKKKKDRANGVKIEMKSTIDGVAIAFFFLLYFLLFFFFSFLFFLNRRSSMKIIMKTMREESDKICYRLKNFQNCLAQRDRIIIGDHRFVCFSRSLFDKPYRQFSMEEEPSSLIICWSLRVVTATPSWIWQVTVIFLLSYNWNTDSKLFTVYSCRKLNYRASLLKRGITFIRASVGKFLPSGWNCFEGMFREQRWEFQKEDPKRAWCDNKNRIIVHGLVRVQLISDGKGIERWYQITRYN